METMGFDFRSFPFPYLESQRDELLHYKELAIKRENEIINQQKTLNNQLRDYIKTRLEHWESKKRTYIVKEENPPEYVSNYNNDPLISTNFFPSILPVSSSTSSSKETNNITTTGKNKPLLAAKWPTQHYFNQQIANSPIYQQTTSTEKPQAPQTNSPIYQQNTSERPLIVPQAPRTNSPMYQQRTSERPPIVPQAPQTNSPMYQQTTSERPLIMSQAPQTNSPMYQQTTSERPLMIPQAPWTNSPMYQQNTSIERPLIVPQTNSPMYQQTTSERPLIVPQAPQTNSPLYQQTTLERPLMIPQAPRTNSPMYQQNTSIERPLIVPQTNSPMYQQTTSERPLTIPQDPQTNSPMYQQTRSERPLMIPQAPRTNSPMYQQTTSIERQLVDPQINVFSQQATRRRRRTSRDVEDPVWKLTAMAKGFLTRRLLQTEKIKDLIKTIKDAEVVLQSLNNPISSQDFDLQQRVINQLQTAKLLLHEIFFIIPVADRMAYITHSRVLRADKRFRKFEENKTNRLSSATLKSLERKKGGTSHSVPKRSHIIRSERKKNTSDKEMMAEKTNTKTKMKLINQKPVDSNKTIIKSNSHQSDSKRDVGGPSSRMQSDSKRDVGGSSSHMQSDSKRDMGGPSSRMQSDSKRDMGGPSSRIPLPLNKTDPKRISTRKKPTTTGQVKRLSKK